MRDKLDRRSIRRYRKAKAKAKAKDNRKLAQREAAPYYAGRID
jgi:hypothetical protein